MRFALVLGVALLAGSVTGAEARDAARVPPIVFSSGQLDRDLVVMQRNGAHRRVLTRVGRDDSDPSWSANGRTIAFSFYNGRRTRVGLLDLRSGRVQDLGDGFNPDWSPDGRKLVFLDAENFDDLVIMDVDGSNRRRLNLPQAVGIADNTDPAWSPDGQEIAFVGDGLWVVSADGSERRRLRPEGGPGTASWSRDGRVLAFDCATRHFHVCTVREDGTRFRGLTRKGRHPKWSPRGGLIATTRLDALKPGILLFRPNGKLVGALRNGSADPAWSPDGKWLVAERELPGGPRLYATDAARGSMARVTQGVYRDSAASWSPDGRSIAFRRFARGSCSIAVVSAASKRVRILVRRTGDPGCVDQPTWSAGRHGHPLRKPRRPLAGLQPRRPCSQGDTNTASANGAPAMRLTAARSGSSATAEPGSSTPTAIARSSPPARPTFPGRTTGGRWHI